MKLINADRYGRTVGWNRKKTGSRQRGFAFIRDVIIQLQRVVAAVCSNPALVDVFLDERELIVVYYQRTPGDIHRPHRTTEISHIKVVARNRSTIQIHVTST
ncbi:hypothetical protein ES703_123587 [subsurface metagenome]